ncbi:DUF6221 family protein [Streptomyces sp. NPDC090022]|uniref:DUF6221 family protein n=1 Tax=Streptomyces sp. NPDC090022 TaxID=3365920 RepID=UPI003820D7A6
MTADLVQFLRARLHEDELIARSVQDRSTPWDGQWVPDGTNVLRTKNGHVLTYGHATTDGRDLPMPLKPGLVDHWARHDPARVLAEVDAKRQALNHYERIQQHTKKSNGGDDYILAEGAVCRQIEFMALPYADHPDYRTEWAPPRP